MSVFVTGTDTGVGKTYVTARWVSALRRGGRDAVGMKPICCGDREDAEALHRASGGAVSLNDINPVWLRTPAAPYTAALIENRPIDLALIRRTFERLKSAHGEVIVEGAGGWLVPIERAFSIADLAKEFALPVVVVVANRLGALNHALLTIAAVRHSGLPLAGWVLNHCAPVAGEEIATTTNRGVLEELTGLPPLFEVGHGQEELTL